MVVTLALLYDFPPFVHWAEIPASAAFTDHPKAPPGRVESESAADGEGLDHSIGAEAVVAINAGLIQSDL